MNLLSAIRDRMSTKLVVLLGLIVGLIAVLIIMPNVDGSAFGEAVSQAVEQPFGMAVALAGFGIAFIFRAVAWRRILPQLPFSHALSAIHLSLGANHVLPFRLGEPLRILSVVRRQRIGLEAATVSTVTLRAADILSVMLVGALVAPSAFFSLVGIVGWVLLAGVLLVSFFGWKWLSSVAQRRADVIMPGPAVLFLSLGAWVAEAILVRQAAMWAGINLSWSEALLVTTVSVAAQIAAIAPGGFGTYEAAAVAAYVVLGYDAKPALIAALGAHALKTAYSILVGVVAVFTPAPSFIGRFRLGKVNQLDTNPVLDADAPILLFMPAYNEEEAVAECIERVPPRVLDRPVEVLIVDDGSVDSTVDRARKSGAQVVELGQNQGLGAAVRTGLEIGVERNAAAVVFCDADGEYPPEELANMVAPILDGEADYVVGSRFLGRIDHMRPHRRFGNHVLTRALQVVARQKISDGQSGYRALSLDAARNAEIIHDFNYAQVLTLDLMAKGFRYREVPISYHFRTTGESFIKLGRYLRNVVPAVYKEINAV
ncbi:MAG: hypothetical protein CL428_07875 [Acidimicrobiaceae bacterium]|jgi:uncharacterized membrane protein YbhN (UPF0104 family)|nr:hypothetical protein [Acidimicrobiaceae bacterium]